MKRFYTKSGKVILSAICIVFALIFVISFLSCVYLGYWGLFSGSKNKFKSEMQEIENQCFVIVQAMLPYPGSH